MNLKRYLALVQEHTGQLRLLSTNLSTTFGQLEQDLDEAGSPPDTEALCLLDGIAELTNSLFCAEERFGRQLLRVLERTKLSTGSAVIH